MASEEVTATQTVQRTEPGNWKGGVLAGVAGGLVMGVMLTTMMTPVIEMAIPAMYGLQGGLAGWVAHMSHAAVLGVVFAAIVGATGYGDNLARSAGLGVAYGVVLWVVLAALVMPVWLSAVGFADPPNLPNFNATSLVGHVVYGLVLGAAYPYVRDL
ncbi:histidine kinase [Halobium salinum]|uniref:Histidine kinase n=1 Tax=Halobium salinum TaxID=1364940 RepID=A0ABD5PGX5_9EURY|nr:histidine kinase [Halobium salinum]